MLFLSGYLQIYLFGSALLAGLGGILLLALIIGLISWHGHRQIKKHAKEDWDYRLKENMQDLRLDEQAYINAYVKTGAPRASKYLALGLAVLALLAIPAFALIELGLHYVWVLSGKSRVFEPPFLVWQYLIYFSFLGFLAAIVWIFVRTYHRRNPGLMRDALIEARADFWPKQQIIIGPNPIHLNAADYGADGYEKLNILFEALGFARNTDDNYANSGHICDNYSIDDALVCVHLQAAGREFSSDTHPFFFPGKFARHDDKPRKGEIIRLMPDAYNAYQKIVGSGLCADKYRKGVRRKTYNIQLPYLEIYLYDGD